MRLVLLVPKIGSQSFLQVFRLTDIQDLPFSVFKLIHSRVVRESWGQSFVIVGGQEKILFIPGCLFKVIYVSPVNARICNKNNNVEYS